MTAVTAFRVLIVLGLVFPIAGAGVGYATAHTLPAPLREHLEAVAAAPHPPWLPPPDSPWIWAVLALVALLLLGLLGLTVGLFRFWRPARRLWVVSTVLCWVAFLPLAGPVVQGAYETLGYDIGLMCSGAVLAMLYLPPIRERFDPPSPMPRA